jgi:hypothetical protein
MYTVEMATAFKSIVPPQNFGVMIYDADDFLTIMIEPKDLENLDNDQAEEIVKYINNVKKTLEDHGAIVLVVRNSPNE